MTDFDFDLIVIGAGPGGYVAAIEVHSSVSRLPVSKSARPRGEHV